MIETVVDNLPAPRSAAETAIHSEVDWSLDDVTRQRLVDSVPENTRRAYALVYRDWLEFCGQSGRVPLPATAETLAAYVSTMITAERAPASVSQHIGAIRTLHSLNGHKGFPDSTQALQLLRGYRRKRAKDGKHEREAPPMLARELKRCVAALDLTSNVGRRDQLVLVLGFALMARRSELARLTLEDVVETSEGVVVLIASSKTDKDSLGEKVALPPGSHPDVDPVALLAGWRQRLADAGIYDGPLIRGVTRTDVFRDGGVSDRTVCEIVRRAAIRAGLDGGASYTAHSLRAGGLTSALQAGAALGIAQRHGRWSEKSPVVIKYARAADRFRDNAMRGVL